MKLTSDICHKVKTLFLLMLLFPALAFGETDLDKVDRLYNKAEKYYSTKKFEISSKFLLRVLEIQPDHSRSLSLLGDIYLQREKYDQAESYFLQASEVSDKPAKEFFRLGQVQTLKKNAEKAQEYFGKCYKSDAQMKKCLFQRGYVALTLERDKARTIEFWEKFLKETPLDRQYDKIKQVLTLLKDPGFELPPLDSEISLEEALMLGGKSVKAQEAGTTDIEAGNEKAKTNNQTEGLLDDGGI